MSRQGIPWVCDARFSSNGRRVYIPWEERKHTLVFGQTGTGKTVSIVLLLAKIGKYWPDSKVILLDYKSEFEELSGLPRYFRYASCQNGMDIFSKYFNARMSGEDKSRTPLIFVADELGAWLNSLERKQADEYKRLLAVWLSLSRSLGITIICGLQRPDASFFGSGGTRDQFSILLGLGNLSKEGISISFSDYKDEIEPVTNPGEGYMLNGSSFHHVQVPTPSNYGAMYRSIEPLLG